MKKTKKKLSVLSIIFVFSTYFVLGYNVTAFTPSNKVYAATVSKTVKVNSVSLNKTKNTLTVGGKDTLIAAVAPSNASNKAVIWKTSNLKVAAVDSKGIVTAVGAGTATITVTTIDGSKTSTYTVIVNNPPIKTLLENNVKSSPSKLTGWKSSNSNVVIVDSNGNMTAGNPGTATITAVTADGSKKATFVVTIASNTPVKVSSVGLNKTKNTLTVGGKDTLTATVAPSNAANKGVIWSTSNNKVATVSNGVVTAVGPGTATITVTTVDGKKTASYVVTVNAANNIVVFKDKNLEFWIRRSINKPAGNIYKSDVENIKNLNIYDKNISDLSGIENLVNLKELQAYSNNIKDISYLKNLTKLKTINLSHNNIKDISALKGLTNLSDVNLKDNIITDLSALSGLINLLNLNLNNNEISDLSSLKGLTNLNNLDLSDNSIVNISSLKGLIALKNLDLINNQIVDVTPLKGLYNLKSLYLSSNHIKDISSLSKLSVYRYGMYTDDNPIIKR